MDLTPARRAGLAVLAHGDATGREVFESNVTTADPARAGHLTVYWQTRQWLADNGLIEMLPGALLKLTADGRILALRAGDPEVSA